MRVAAILHAWSALSAIGRSGWLRGFLLTFVGLATCGSWAHAGCGPENCLLIVNANRPDSLAIANHYRSLRQIPSSNIVYLDWHGPTDTITVDRFREQILEPVFREIERRRIEKQIDLLVYSSGFPYRVDFRTDIHEPVSVATGTMGSLTGMTYLQSMVRSRDLNYLFTEHNQRSNAYYGGITRGFRQRYGWDTTGQRSDAQGQHYYLSVMLGYTEGRGNSVPEVIRYLRRGAMADGTHPNGTVYFMRIEGEIRSSTRDAVFPQVTAELQQEGVKSKIVRGALPTNERDMMGAVVGLAEFQWDRYRCETLPGAIVEHLTSFGGDLRIGATQTPCTEFLRHGAIGTSGTVMEPMALQAKFPHPRLHLHYARGATMAEAFYQSVASPYQLLILGDPLCRPWAKIPEVSVEGIPNPDEVTGTLMLRPNVTGDVAAQMFEVYVDGRMIGAIEPGQIFELDTKKVADGYHELRIVAIEASPVESQGRLLIPIRVNNHNNSIEWTIRPLSCPPGGVFQVYAIPSRGNAVQVFQNRRLLATIREANKLLTIPADSLGQGPSTITVVGVGDKPTDRIFGAPVEVYVRDTTDPVSQTVGTP